MPIFACPNNNRVLFANFPIADCPLKRYILEPHREYISDPFFFVHTRDVTAHSTIFRQRDFGPPRHFSKLSVALISKGIKRKRVEKEAEEREREFHDRHAKHDVHKSKRVIRERNSEIVIGLEEERARRGSEATRRGRRERKEGRDHPLRLHWPTPAMSQSIIRTNYPVVGKAALDCHSGTMSGHFRDVFCIRGIGSQRLLAARPRKKRGYAVGGAPHHPFSRLVS